MNTPFQPNSLELDIIAQNVLQSLDLEDADILSTISKGYNTSVSEYKEEKLTCKRRVEAKIGREALIESTEEISNGCAVGAIGALTGAALPFLILSRSPVLVLVPSLIIAHFFTKRQIGSYTWAD